MSMGSWNSIRGRMDRSGMDIRAIILIGLKMKIVINSMEGGCRMKR